ncbi:MAG: MerR family DNA-binding protein [Gammaproteobacteria bacterium]|nr:MerR family DNA-binding protein [Gammaproteobacteria bacterium]
MTTSITIGSLARRAGVNIETVRYYQRRGLLATPRKPSGGVRHYDADALARLQFIKRAQQLGFTLNEIRDLLSLGNGDCNNAHALATRRLNDIEARLRDLAAMRRSLTKLIRCCRDGKEPVCPIVRTLSGHDT